MFSFVLYISAFSAINNHENSFPIRCVFIVFLFFFIVYLDWYRRKHRQIWNIYLYPLSSTSIYVTGQFQWFTWNRLIKTYAEPNLNLNVMKNILRMHQCTYSITNTSRQPKRIHKLIMSLCVALFFCCCSWRWNEIDREKNIQTECIEM